MTLNVRPTTQLSRSSLPLIGRISPTFTLRQPASAAVPAAVPSPASTARSPPKQRAPLSGTQPSYAAAPFSLGAGAPVAPRPWALKTVPQTHTAPSSGLLKMEGSGLLKTGSLTAKPGPASRPGAKQEERRPPASPCSGLRPPGRMGSVETISLGQLSPKSAHAASQKVLPVKAQTAVPSPTAISLTLPVNGDGREAQVQIVRESLLQQIQCVQREIARLQDERGKLSKPPQSAVLQMKQVKPMEAKPVESRSVTVDKAIRRLQRWWRKRRRGLPHNRQRCQGRPLRMVHYAAARIQRCFRIYRWRRRFVDVSVRQVGWLGSLLWLQEQNLLYGTELADKEDVRWWAEQRATAPLDREVDPWGALKLREHLDKMWFGHANEDTAKEEELLLLHHHQKQLRQQEQQKQQQKLQRQQQQQRQQQPAPKTAMTAWTSTSNLRTQEPQVVRDPSLHSSHSLQARPANVDWSPVPNTTHRGLSATVPKKCKSSSLTPRSDPRQATGKPGTVLNSYLGAPRPAPFALPNYVSTTYLHRPKSPVTSRAPPTTSWAPAVVRMVRVSPVPGRPS